MAVLVAHGIEKSFGDRHVLRGCDLVLEPGERIGLVGANGCGKSTLLRIIGGRYEADFGELERPDRVSLLDQEPLLPGHTVGEAADEALAWHRELLADYERALEVQDMDAAARLQSKIELHGWSKDHEVDALLDRLSAPPRDALVEQLSGGERRRVALARALLGSPDILLLDEPTNHLDSETADWLQGWLLASNAAVVLVTHDRYLLEAVATRIVEVEDGLCVSYDGSYGDYLIERAERRALQQRGEDSRLAFIAREAVWAARSPAARSTKQKARLDRLDQLRRKRPIKREETFELDLSSGEKTGRTLLDLRDLEKGYDGCLLFRGLHASLGPGDRLGILGPNGCGKSTLLRLITGEERPDAGSVQRASRVKVAVLDQHRSGLNPKHTVFDAAGNGASHVTLADRQIHVAGFLRRFLFPRDMLTQSVSSLSGGERARLLMAKLLLQGCNLLLLDEPTNDLDLQTLRVLEEALLSFDGAVLVVTHDRAFIDRVCTGLLAFEGEGVVTGYASREQYSKAAAQRRSAEQKLRSAAQKKAKAAEQAKTAVARSEKKLSYKEQREIEALPPRIDALEQEQRALDAKLADPALYKEQAPELPGLTARAAELAALLAASYKRWEELEARS